MKVKLIKVRDIQGTSLMWGPKGADGKPTAIKVGDVVECGIPELTAALCRRGLMPEIEGKKLLAEAKTTAELKRQAEEPKRKRSSGKAKAEKDEG